MTTTSSPVRDHYQSATTTDLDGLLARIDAMLGEIAGPITTARLARLDQFHLGGLAATAELARRLALRPEHVVLDAGSGFGGPSRYLAETSGCRVIGIDLAPDFVAVAKMLTDRAGLADRVSFRVGDLLELPLDDASVDAVWTQHVAMNIRDKVSLYRELRRVLKPSGQLAFFDPIAAHEGAEPFYPVPWATSPATSTLLTEGETVAVIEQAGFRLHAIEDMTAQAMGWASQPPPSDGATMTLASIVGPQMGDMVANFGRSLKEGRVRLSMGVFDAV